MDTYEELKKVIQLPLQYNHRKDYLNYSKASSEGYNHWLNISDENRKMVDTFMENFYDSSFTLDDIYDDNKIRRGEPTAFCIYGKVFTFNAALLANVQLIEDAFSIGKSEAVNIVIHAIKSGYEGQGIEIYWRDCNICPTEHLYKKNAAEKGSATQICHFKLMQLFSKNKTDYNGFIERLGLYYQLVNDNMALAHDVYQKKNGFLTDITEGKFTLPIIHAIEKEGADPKLRNILKMRTDNREIKLFALSLLNKHKSIEYAETAINELREELRREIVTLGGDPVFEKFDNLELYEEDF